MKELLRNKNTRKIFGKKEVEIIRKQLDGIMLTQSEKNRLSRDIRPKFDFIKEAGKYQEEFALEKNQNNKRVIDDAITRILEDEKEKSIKAVLLYGSFADNSFTKRSDIDICVLFDVISLEEATRFRMRVSGKISQKIDLQVFNVLPQKIKKDIARNHRVLYRAAEFDNLSFSLRHCKQDGYKARMERIFGVPA